MSSYHFNTRAKAEQALRQAKPSLTHRQISNELYPAIIISANGDGWDVATVDASYNIGRTYERVFPWPVGTTFTEQQEVWVWAPSNGETPVIFAAGGGGGGTTCAISINVFGVYGG